MKGIIKKLEARGFGFITVEGQKDLFFHANDCTEANFKELKEGDAVSFKIAESEKGPKAIEVTLDSGMEEEETNTDTDAEAAPEADEADAA